MGVLNSIKVIAGHPLTRDARFAAFKRVGVWQIGSRLLPGPICMPYVNDSRLLISHGMTGATGSIYLGLPEFEQMSFLMHYLCSGDTFIDVGANVGSYTILASAVVGARTIAFEPAQSEFDGLIANIRLNRLESLVDARQIAIGNKTGLVSFWDSWGAGSRINQSGNGGVQTPISTLDAVINETNVRLIKIDVEGFELDVLEGAERLLAGAEPLVLIVEMIGAASVRGIDDNQVHSKILGWGFKACRYNAFTREISQTDTLTVEGNNVLYARGVEAIKDRLKTAPPFKILGRTI